MSVSKRLRFKILERDQFACRYCGRMAPAVELQVDHIHPVSKGGADTMDNLVASCAACNQSKKAYTIVYPPAGQIVCDPAELALIRNYRRELQTRVNILCIFEQEEALVSGPDWEYLSDPAPEHFREKYAFPDDFYEPDIPPIKLDFDWRAAAALTPSPEVSMDILIPLIHGDN